MEDELFTDRPTNDGRAGEKTPVPRNRGRSKGKKQQPQETPPLEEQKTPEITVIVDEARPEVLAAAFEPVLQHEKVAPGIYTMAAERYFASEGVSKSMLDILAEKTPYHLKSYLRGEWEDSTAATEFGSVAHRALLEPDTFKDGFYVKPENMRFSTKDGIAWRDDHKDKPIITFDDARRVENIVRSTQKHPFAKRLLHGGLYEQAIFAFDHKNTLRKCRLDALTKGNAIPDVKICDSALQLEDFQRRISRYRYHVQAAYYLDLCKLAGIQKDLWYFILAEKNPPYTVRCLRLMPLAIEIGRKCYQRDLQIYRNCVEADDWPAYEPTFADVALSDWEMRQWEKVL